MRKKDQLDQTIRVQAHFVERRYQEQQNALRFFKESIRRLIREEKSILKGSAENFQIFVSDVLALMNQDIYLSTFPEKEDLVSRLPLLIGEFFKRSPLDVQVISQVLVQLSFENIKLEFDKAWLHESRHVLFEKVVRRMVDIFVTSLRKLGKQGIRKIPMLIIAEVTQSISRWKFKFSPDVIEALISNMEIRYIEGLPLSSEVAFCFLDGLSALTFKNNPKRSMLIEKIAKIALPKLLEDDPPLVMFPAKNLTLFRIGNIKRLLPQPAPEIYSAPSLKIVTRDMMEAEMPGSMIPNKRLHAALNAKETQLLESSESKNWHGKAATIKEGSQLVLTTNPYIKYIQYFKKINHPKGLQWYALRYSQNILSGLQRSGGLRTYSLKSIQDFLKLFRNCLLNLDFSSVKDLIRVLAHEALSDFHADKMDANIAINLLWINMVLSTVSNDPSVSYSRKNQAKLFKKVLNHGINESEARALYEIKAMQWHGKIPFSRELNQHMRQHFQKFSAGVNPSSQEREIYQVLRTALPSHLRVCLRANTICPKTGHEIDIAYTRRSKKQKIAIHVDGPAHFDIVTGLTTLKTQFRDLCLTAAGWHSIAINITKPYDLTRIIAQLNQLIQEKELTASSRPKESRDSKMSGKISRPASVPISDCQEVEQLTAPQKTFGQSSCGFFGLSPSAKIDDESSSDDELALAISLSLRIGGQT